MKNNEVIDYYRRLKKYPFEITEQLVSSVIHRNPNRALGMYGFIYDFNNNSACECNYDIAYNTSSKK